MAEVIEEGEEDEEFDDLDGRPSDPFDPADKILEAEDEDMEELSEEDEDDEEDLEDEKEDGLSELVTLTQLESKFASEEGEEVDFDDMWDNASCDASTAMEFERKKKEKKAKKKKKDKKRHIREKKEEKEAKEAQENRRLRLFEKSSSSDNGKAKANAAFSPEFVNAINRVFDDDEEDETTSLGDGDDGETVVEMPIGTLQRTGSEGSLYKEQTGSKSRTSNNSIEDEDVSREDNDDDDNDEFEEDDDDDGDDDDETEVFGKEERDDDDDYAGSIASKSKRSRVSKKSRGAKSLGSLRETSSKARSKASSRRSRHTTKTSMSRHSSRSKKPQISAAQEFEAEMKRIQGDKVLSISNLRQEMADRRGTSVNLVKKEYATYRKKQHEHRKAVEDGDLDFSNKGDTGLPLSQIGFARSNSRNLDTENKNDMYSASGIVGSVVRGEEDGQAKKDGLAGHFSRWDRAEGVTDLDDLKTVNNEQESPRTGGLLVGMVNNMPNPMMATNVLPDLPAISDIQNRFAKATPFPKPSDTGFPTSFSEMGMSMVPETSEDEFGLLSTGDDDFDAVSVRSGKSHYSMASARSKRSLGGVKMPKIKNPLKKLVTGKKRDSGPRMIDDMDLLEDNDERGLLG